MRFGNGRVGLNIGPEEVRSMTCSNLGCGIELPVPINGSRPAYSQECLLNAQAKCLLSIQGDIKRI
jgi:hypothetical protein